jgi:hypothetical protein
MVIMGFQEDRVELWSLAAGDLLALWACPMLSHASLSPNFADLRMFDCKHEWQRAGVYGGRSHPEEGKTIANADSWNPPSRPHLYCQHKR